MMDEAKPFSHEGNSTAIVLCHGFTGSPQALRPLADACAAAGYTVRSPLLPGHGTTWRDMNETTWPQWYQSVADAVEEVRDHSTTRIVVGLSMGGGLALRLAENYGSQLHGVIVINPQVKFQHPLAPLLPLLSRVLPSVPGITSDIKREGINEVGYDRVPLRALNSMVTEERAIVRDLPSVTQPLLVFRSATDHVVPASNSTMVLERVSSTIVEEVILTNSYHVATLDNDAELITSRSLDFIAELAT